MTLVSYQYGIGIDMRFHTGISKWCVVNPKCCPTLNASVSPLCVNPCTPLAVLSTPLWCEQRDFHTHVNDFRNKHAGKDQDSAHSGFIELFNLLLEYTRTISKELRLNQ